jgi:hypothetical protein
MLIERTFKRKGIILSLLRSLSLSLSLSLSGASRRP